MDFTQGSLMNMLPEKWNDIFAKIQEAKKSGEKQVLIHKQYLPLDSCHVKLQRKINEWLQAKDKELYAKICDDRLQGCFYATNAEVFVAW